MKIYRHKDNGRLYKIYIVSPPKIMGQWMESEDMISGEKRKLNQSSWRFRDFESVAEK